MSKLDSIKQQYPELNISIVDVLARLDSSKTYKYLPMFCKIMRGHRNNQKWNEEERKGIEDHLKSKNINVTTEESMDWKFILALCSVSDSVPRDLFDGSKEFIEYMERGLIENKDVLTYTSIEDMRGALALASLKAQSKELEKQVVKVHEDDEWLVVRPLTFEASAKYGAGTKWCTTYQTEKQYFARYWRRGILAYFINKKNGNKWGMFKNIDSSYEDELSWWNVADKRVDFLEINFNEKMYGVVRKLLQSKDANKYLCDEDLQYRVLVECDPVHLPIAEPRYINLNETQLTPQYVEPPYPEPVMEQERMVRAEGLDLRDPALEEIAERFHQAIDEHVVQQIREYGTRIISGAQVPSRETLNRISDEIQQYQRPQTGG
jgi:hypothetical protein